MLVNENLQQGLQILTDISCSGGTVTLSDILNRYDSLNPFSEENMQNAGLYIEKLLNIYQLKGKKK